MLSTVPSNSKAAVVRQFRTPLCIEEVPIPKELEPGAVLTRIETCSICGTDVHLWQGSLALKVELPVIIGHEMVGRIVALGSGAEQRAPGRAPARVLLQPTYRALPAFGELPSLVALCA